VAIRTGRLALKQSFRNDAGGVDFLSALALSSAEARMLGHTKLVARLVESGSSRLTAERVAEVELGSAEPGRARPHTQARRSRP
jgi:hypothetical protein